MSGLKDIIVHQEKISISERSSTLSCFYNEVSCNA